MDTVWRLLGASPSQEPPPRVDTDDIYPVHMLDSSGTLRGIIITWTLRFNDVLDPDQLHESLSKLLEMGDWRKIGGRLRLTDEGALEIHVPRPFSTERPAVAYSHESLLDLSIEDHELAKSLPKATEGPSVQAGPAGFQALAARKGAPSTLDDFIYHDIPQMSLHITSFKDATLVALSWPHTLMDVMGQHALLRGWSLVLAGRDSEVPQVLGAREDALLAAVDEAAEEEDFRLGKELLQGFGLVRFGVRFGWDMMSNPPVQNRTIFLPQKAMTALRQQVESDLATGDGSKRPFVSDGDILTAWAARAVAASQPRPRPVSVLHAVNTRFRLPSLIAAPGVYIQNMAVASFAFLSSEVATGRLGQIALANRRHLAEQTTEGQVLACLRELHLGSKTGGDPKLVCGDPDAVLMPFTNWGRADVFRTADFSPALVRAGETGPSRRNPPGTIVYHHADSMRPNSAARNVVVVLGKDHGGNYWLTGLLLPATWARIEEDMKGM